MTKLHFYSETEQKNAFNLLADPTMNIFLSIKADYDVNFRVWIAWLRTILPIYPLMHDKFK